MACLIGCLIVVGSRPVRAQMITTNLRGRILNAKGQGVAGARVRIVDLETGWAREITTNARGEYFFLELPPDTYQFTVLARGYATLLNSRLKIGIGETAEYSPTLRASTRPQTQTITTQPALIVPTRTETAFTVSQREINDLPINLRDYFQFVLLSSAIKPDDTPLSGAFPTSGLNFNGQNARGNEVYVLGGDATDAAVGGIRSTVALEDVREFQVLENDYPAEYGRATGGAISVVTKSGTNEVHGDLYGFVRDSRVQARNPFSVQVDPTTGVASAYKPPYTRVQAGASIGGALQQNRFFYYLSGEALRFHGDEFSSIGENNFGLISATIPCLASPIQVTAQQASYFQKAIPAAGGCGSPEATPLIRAAQLYGAASDTALNGESQATALLNNVTGVPTTFPLPVDCNYLVINSCTPSNVVPLPQSYVGLTSAMGSFPVTQRTYIGTIRLDRVWNRNQRSFLQGSLSPSYQTGIQVNAPNQTYGLDAGSRTSEQNYIDQALVAQHTILFSDTLANVTRFQYARRGLHFGYSPLTTTVGTTTTNPGSNPGVNIPGVAFLGREPFSTIDRTEKRWELADNVTWVTGQHTVKFGADFNLLQLVSTPSQIFDLNYGGVYNFNTLDAGFLQLPGLPAFSAVQAYGLGMPQNFVQGMGQSYQPFDEKIIGGFAQDSWQLNPRLTVNYGVRYDVNLTPILPPATTINAAAGTAMKVVQGIPRDYKDIAPRVGIAWDPTGRGKTVVRAGFGMFYGQTPLMLAFESSAADGAQSMQLETAGGLPTGAAVTSASAVQTMNASSIFQGVLGGIPSVTSAGFTLCGNNLPVSLGYQCADQRFAPSISSSLLNNQSYLAAGFPLAQLPFTLPVASNFVNGYSEQGSLTIEHQFWHNYKVSLGYTWVHGVHLFRSRNINQTNPVLLAQNYANAVKAGLEPSGPLNVSVPSAAAGSCVSTSGTSSVEVISSGQLGTGYSTPDCGGTPFGYIGTPAVFNFFRPSGPNPSFAGQDYANYDQLVALAKQAGFPAGFGVPVAWGDVNQQESSGSSLYDGLTLALSKRFSDNFELLSSWTWSHALDDLTGLTTLYQPQNNNNPNLSWGNSAFDQRQRWVTSAVIDSPYRRKQKGILKKVLADSFVAPIIVVASGRPYTVITGVDTNLNFNPYTDRPSVVASGAGGSVSSPYISGVSFGEPTVCAAGIPKSVTSPFGQTVPIQPYGCTGNLGRNTFVTPDFFNIDLRLDKKFYLTDTLNFEFTADAFNLLNRFNVLNVNQVCDPASGVCNAGQPTEAFNARQFQFGLKFNF
jgi:hypothetical protein